MNKPAKTPGAQGRNAPATQHPQTEAIPSPLEIHPSVSPKAAELLMRTAEHLAMYPAAYDQAHCSLADHPCGSACCILGHMTTFAGFPNGAIWPERIGLTQDQMNSIFLIGGWPRPFVDKCVSAGWDGCYKSCTATIGIARIEHFLRTGA